jgi:hypothetical protein
MFNNDRFAALYKTWHPLLSRYARRIVGNHLAARSIAAGAISRLADSSLQSLSYRQLREQLREATRRACHAWLRQQALRLRRQHKI